MKESPWLLEAVFLVFLIFKLQGIIHWSWWYVTMPLWGTVAIRVLIQVVAEINKREGK